MNNLKRVTVLVGLVTFSSPAMSVDCLPGNPDRQMSLEPASGGATCAAVGSGMPENKAFHEDLGLEKIEKLEDGQGEIEGETFTIQGLGDDYVDRSLAVNGSVYSAYEGVHVAFKFGGPEDPDWFSYGLDSVESAEWEFSDRHALSNVALWGRETQAAVPAPVTVGLLGAGLVGLGVACRRKSNNGGRRSL